MFIRRCSTCERRQLVFPSQLAGIATTAHGVEVSYRCWCGDVQSFETEHVDQVMPRIAA